MRNFIKNILKSFKFIINSLAINKLERPIVAIIPLHGVIRKSTKFNIISSNSLIPLIEKAFKIPRLKALCLLINSPGGSPVQSQIIAETIRSFASEKKVKVYAFCEDVAASGGYYLALAADEIFAAPSSIVGSIGVVSSGFGFDKFISKHSIDRRIYTQGKNKAMLDPFSPEKKEDIAHIKTLQKDIHEEFIAWVLKRRQKKIEKSNQDIFSGKFWTAKEAKKLGLIDDIAYLDLWLRKKYGKKLKKKYFTRKKSIFSSPVSIKIDSEDLINQLNSQSYNITTKL